ncbi:ligase-associated DNA damage response endonuclease PdeM [Rhodobacteraceae bacterium W635]|uniref:ligase-associated DNA damage response endonuclease PdeM n=1 Tax=Nioella halotolerans TaxID=2303578 RepID=UPI000E3DF5CB|nr:ligase-associated DNA damage response endonuclease PdeM [Rhodobacteraceae bacterium W635]
MNGLPFPFAGETLAALPSGALHWPGKALLCVSDLHLGKSERMARRGGPILPPYEARETLDRLAADISATGPETVICLGDSFDDLAAMHALEAGARDRLATLMAGRRWIWIAGNHDPGPVDLGGSHVADHREGALIFRHIASEASGEISGHYHPKARLSLRGRSLTRPCFLRDARRLILPAYGTYTGGLYSHSETLTALMDPDAQALLLADPPLAVPMPR